MRKLFNAWKWVIHRVSFEFVLNPTHRANGGDVILLRALFIAAEFFLIAIALRNLFDPMRTYSFSRHEFQIQIVRYSKWYGPIFAAVYAALYARFASQWTYLANLYNQIKAAEISAVTRLVEKNSGSADIEKVSEKIAEWKAGFIEDAENLHLAMKKSFVPIIYFWLREVPVKKAYCAATPDATSRIDQITKAVSAEFSRLGGTTAPSTTLGTQPDPKT